MLKIIILSISLIAFLNGEALKNIKFKSEVVSKITSVYDGDTFRADIKNYPKIVGYRMSIRINGIDAPEMKAKCTKEKVLAIKAKKLTTSLLINAKYIELKDIKRGKYFRIIANVYADGVSVGSQLLKAGYAVRYNGGTKIDWCK